MKKTFALLLAHIVPAICLAQSPDFTIRGKIGNLNAPAKIYIDYSADGGGGQDSAILKNGAFEFSGTVGGNAFARIALAHQGDGKEKAIYTGDVIYIHFGPENMVMSSADSLGNAKITGSKVYDESEVYNQYIGGTIMALTKAVNEEFSRGTPEQQQDSLFIKQVDTRYRATLARRAERQIQFAKENPKSFFALVGLSEATNPENIETVEPVFKALDPSLQNTDTGREIAQRINASKTIKMGSIAPVFSQNGVDGKAISLADFKGKTVLIEFWASWCAPCRVENPNLVAQYETYKDKGFDILSVSLDSKKEHWLKAIEDDQLPWTQVSDLKGWSNEVGRLYGIRAVPASFLVGPDGRIIGIGLRGESLNEKLAELFN